MVLFEEEDRHVANTIPAGSIVEVEPGTFDGNKLVYVSWAGRRVMMFAQDLRNRGEKVT